METQRETWKLKGNFMETKSLKTLARKVLGRNSQGNLKETESFHREKLEGEKVSNENTAYCYWLKSIVDDCQMPCFEIDAKTVNHECPHFREYGIKLLQNTGGKKNERVFRREMS